MGIKVLLEKDLKQAMLNGDRVSVDALRGIKTAILNDEIARGRRQSGLSDEEIITILKRESKKRQEAIELYQKAGSVERAAKEQEEKRLIDAYLPQAMSDAEIEELIDQAVAIHGTFSSATMGQIIVTVKQASRGRADGSDIARLVKARIA